MPDVNVKIPRQLFVDLVLSHLAGDADEAREERICRGLQVKLDALVRHDRWVKTAHADEESRSR